MSKILIENINDAVAVIRPTFAEKSWNRFADPNRMTRSIRANYINKRSRTGLDQVAMSLQEYAPGLDEKEIIESIIDFAETYPYIKDIKAYLAQRELEQNSGGVGKSSKGVLDGEAVNCFVKDGIDTLGKKEFSEQLEIFEEEPGSYFGSILEVDNCKSTLFNLSVPEQKKLAQLAILKLKTWKKQPLKPQLPRSQKKKSTSVKRAGAGRKNVNRKAVKKQNRSKAKALKIPTFKALTGRSSVIGLPLKIVDSIPSVSVDGRVDSYAKREGIDLSKATRLLNKSGLNIKDVDQHEIKKRYRLKGFEYGNWATNEERFNFLVSSRVSLEQLKELLGFSNLGLNGLIGVAFGARGKGGGASAHFEPWTFMINLTRKNGYSSFAHEYGHALDYAFGTYIDQDKESAALSYGRTTRRVVEKDWAKNSLRSLMNDIINTVNYDPKFTAEQIKKDKLPPHIAKLRITSAYRTRLVGLDDYWIRRNEIFARIFEQYCQYKLSQKGIKNNYLVQSKYSPDVYLKQSEFNSIRVKMDTLIRRIAQLANSLSKK
jgi:hypothetical protein